MNQILKIKINIMKKIYEFEYDLNNAEVKFEVDDTIFTEKVAKETLNFFYMPNVYCTGNTIIDTLRFYAEIIISELSFNNNNVYSVKEYFKNAEGLYPLDGSVGIRLISGYGFEFDNSLLKLKE